MADIPVFAHGEDGAAAIAGKRAAAVDDTMPNDGNSLLLVDNASGGARVVTAGVPNIGKCNQGFSHMLQVSVGAGAQRWLGPFPTERFGASVAITYDGVTSTTVAVSKLGKQLGVS